MLSFLRRRVWFLLAVVSVCSGLFFSLEALAQSAFSPVVAFDSFVLFDTTGLGPASQTYVEVPPDAIDKGHFPLFVGATAERIQAYIQNGGPLDKPFLMGYFSGLDYRFKTYALTNEITLLEASYFYYSEDTPNRTFPRMLGTYILKNGISIGVLLFDNLRVYRPQEAAYYQAIRQLPRDRSALRQAMPEIPVKKVQFLQAPRTDQWIEKYVLMHVQLPAQEMYKTYHFSRHAIMLQAFYPAELESVLQDYIIRTLAHNVEHVGILEPESTSTPLNQRVPEIQQEQMGDESEN